MNPKKHVIYYSILCFIVPFHNKVNAAIKTLFQMQKLQHFLIPLNAYVFTTSYLNCQEVLSYGNAVKTDSTQSDAKLTSIVFGCLIRFYNYR